MQYFNIKNDLIFIVYKNRFSVKFILYFLIPWYMGSISDFSSRLVRNYLFRGGKIDSITSSIKDIINRFFEGAKHKTEDEIYYK